MNAEELMREIREKKIKRDKLHGEVSSLKRSIAYYKAKGNRKKVNELKEVLRKVQKEYEKAKAEVNRLYEFWRQNFAKEVHNS